MRLRYFSVLFFLLILEPCRAQIDVKTDFNLNSLEYLKLKGPVSLLVDSIPYAMRSLQQFDQAGKLLRYEAVPLSPALKKWADTIVYQYNTQGRMVSEMRSHTGSVIRYEYDADYRACTRIFEEPGEPTRRLVDSFDAHNRLTRTILADNVIHFEYNKAGQLQKSISTSDDGGFNRLMDSSTFTYNLKGQLIRRDMFGSTGLYQYWTYRYDSYGSLKEEILFDPQGQEIRRNEINYRYDAKGNWIEKSETKDGRGPFRAFRRIVYY